MDSLIERYTESKVIRILAAAGADAVTPLISAAAGCDTELLKTLLDACDTTIINTAGKAGETALHVALSNGYLRNTKLLLQAGARISQADTHRFLVLSVTSNNVSMIKLLLEFLPIQRYKSLNALAPLTDSRFKNLKLLLTETQPMSILMHACLYGRFEIVKLLMKHSGLNQIDTNGNTALDYAMLSKNDELVSFLKISGAESGKTRRPDVGSKALAKNGFDADKL